MPGQRKIEAWRIDYDTFRPHSSLGYLTPKEYADKHESRETSEAEKPTLEVVQ